jgi:hypothetical protein
MEAEWPAAGFGIWGEKYLGFLTRECKESKLANTKPVS